MKLIKCFLCASAAVLVITCCGCKKKSKSGSGGSDDFTNPNGKRMSAEAEAAKCMVNMKTLAMAMISCAQADDVYGHFPAAGYYRTREINLGRSKGNRRQYYPHRPWISPKGNVYDLNHTLQTVYMGDPAHFSDSEDDWRLAVTNGAIWHAMGEVFEAYRCPIHTREFEKKNKRPPGWSYMMNQEFGYDRNEGKWSHFHGASIHGKITVATEASGKRDDGSASRDHDKVLMFAEIQAIDIQDEEYGYIQAVSDHSSTESDAVLDPRSSTPWWMGPSLYIWLLWLEPLPAFMKENMPAIRRLDLWCVTVKGPAKMAQASPFSSWQLLKKSESEAL